MARPIVPTLEQVQKSNNNTHLHVSVNWGSIAARGNLDLGKLIHLDLEETRGFSIPSSAIPLIKESEALLSIVGDIIAKCVQGTGAQLDEFLDDNQVTFGAGSGQYQGIFSKDSVEADESAESYSMVLYLSAPNNGFFDRKLHELADRFEEEGIAFFVAAGTSRGDFDEGSAPVGPAARIDANFKGVELYIVDDEICIEEG